MGRRGRPPHPGPLTPAEERVLAFIREGKANAEIAVRLGVSVNTVRYHVSNLLSKAGAASREELARWRPRTERGEGGRRRGFGWVGIPALKAGLLTVSGIAVGALMVGVILSALGDGDESAAELPAPFVPVDERALQDAGFVDTGPFLRTERGGDPVLGHSPRDLFTVLLVDEGPLLVGEEGHTWPQPFVLGNGTVEVRLTWQDRDYLVHMSVVNQPYVRDRIRSTDTPEVVRLIPGTDRGMFLHVTDDTDLSPASSDRWEPTNRATVSSDGHLWIQTTRMEVTLAADEWTGSALDTAGAVDAGAIDAENQYMMFAGCTDGFCWVSYRPALPLLAPIAGLLTCESSSMLRLDGDEVTLRFEWADTGYGGPPEFDCEPHEVNASDRIAPNRHYVITAYRPDGQQISLAVSQDGRLHAGNFAPSVGCPCRGGT